MADTDPMPEDDGRWQESDVGITAPCGCEVSRANIACGDLGPGADESYGHDYPQTDCPYCQFGVPAVWHEDTCRG